MKVLIDMNLSPSWAGFLEKNGHSALHWITVGLAHDADVKIFQWAQQHEYIIFTNDLDFGAILALSGERQPSVIQARTDLLLPKSLGQTVLAILHQFSDELHQGVLISFDEKRAKVRRLPLR